MFSQVTCFVPKNEGQKNVIIKESYNEINAVVRERVCHVIQLSTDKNV